MKILSALNYEAVEEFIRKIPGVSLLDIAVDKKSLLEKAGSAAYDLVLVSKELTGSEEMQYLIEALTSEEYKRQRVVYIYGEYDSLCDGFTRFLLNRGVYDFHIGEAITSKEIERLIFRPAGKDNAFGYFNSRFDNEYYFDHKYNYRRESKRRAASLDQSLKLLFKNKGAKKILLERMVISIISNQATGKSHTAWNLACALSEHKYITSLINIDRGYSANLFFNIDELYYDLLDFTIRKNNHKDILNRCFRKKSLSIVTGKLGQEKEIEEADFLKLLYGIRTKSDITIIDTWTGLTALTRLSIKNSTYDLMIFDCDIMHFHMNMCMIEELKDDFIPEKTIAVINNTNVKSQSHKFIYNELVKSGIPFKDIAVISSCSFLSSELMHTGLSPYHAAGEENKDFVGDVDNLIERLSARAE